MQYETVSAFSAKTHFSQLLVEVQGGKQFMITKHNEPIAMLVPLEKAKRSSRTTKETIEAIIELSKKNTLGKDLTLNDLKNEGRR
jgi:prevent-host-death family protein